VIICVVTVIIIFVEVTQSGQGVGLVTYSPRPDIATPPAGAIRKLSRLGPTRTASACSRIFIIGLQHSALRPHWRYLGDGARGARTGRGQDGNGIQAECRDQAYL
jgi:hypothetical protein